LVAMQVDEQDRVSRRVIGLLGLGSTPRRATAAEESIIGNPVNELVAEDIGRAAMTGLDDIPTDLQRCASETSAPGFCRCTGYQGIVAAAHRTAETMCNSVTQR
jgi:aerobic carbon-monoxide dehydrogenase medium subunit